jgi:hypothetical protein
VARETRGWRWRTRSLPGLARRGDRSGDGIRWSSGAHPGVDLLHIGPSRGTREVRRGREGGGRP